MQRNFSFFHTIDKEKCEFVTNLEEFHISPHGRCEEIKNLPCFVVVKSVLLRITLFLRNPFWRDLRAFAWRKIEPKNDKYEVCSEHPIQQGYQKSARFVADNGRTDYRQRNWGFQEVRLGSYEYPEIDGVPKDSNVKEK